MVDDGERTRSGSSGSSRSSTVDDGTDRMRSLVDDDSMIGFELADE